MNLQIILKKLTFRQHLAEEAPSEDLYTVVANNLTLEEIRRSNMPDKHLDTTHFEFKSRAERTYSAGQVNRDTD